MSDISYSFDYNDVTMDANLICDNDVIAIDVVKRPENIQYVHFFISLGQDWGQYGFIFVTVKSDDKTTWHMVSSGDVIINLFPFAIFDESSGVYSLPDSLEISICGRSEYVGEKNSENATLYLASK